ncbi:hypothetical protein DFJ77DRAFT_309830 [Powellomyces hirtus]|nr:hypothetical protein DFJ77DRAFT_309830 [Powellomyces hirtus]
MPDSLPEQQSQVRSHTSRISTRPASAATTAAITIQRYVRGHLVRRSLIQQHRAAITIQRHVRGDLARRVIRPRIADARRNCALDREATVTRNRIVARERNLQLLRSVPDVHAWEAARVDNAVRLMQRCWRGAAARERVRRHREQMKKNAAAAAVSSKSTVQKPVPVEQPKVDRQPVYDDILAHLSARRRSPLPATYAPPIADTGVHLAKAANSNSTLDVFPLMAEIDLYIDFLTKTSDSMLAGGELPEFELPAIEQSTAGVDIRQEHQRAQRRAKGHWWENRTEEEWDEWVAEETGTESFPDTVLRP